MDGRPKQFIFILIAALMVLGSVMTASATVTITGMTPGTGTVYSTATITGTCSSATSGTMTINFGTVTVGTAAVTGTGSFTCVFTVPLHIYGTETITATHDGADGSATTTFFVIPNIINISPASNVVGTIVTITGTGYGTGDTITIAFGINTNIQQATADASGSFTTTFTVDTQVYGTTTISASSSAAGTASTTFFILPQIYSVTPSTGSVGTIVTINGTGYANGDSITVMFGANTNIVGTTALASGSFT
ncbi:IPT/TIG domain-containing protein, partial [bacterium]|nr:IPT/TIG domain-containing protein [bacterium]